MVFVRSARFFPALPAMPAPHVVLLASSISLRPVFPYFLFSNSFPCHRSENSPVSLAIATLPETAVSNPCVCHTSETPRGSYSQHSNLQLSTFRPFTVPKSIKTVVNHRKMQTAAKIMMLHLRSGVREAQ